MGEPKIMSFSFKSDLSVETSSLPHLSWLLDGMPWDKWNCLRNSRFSFWGWCPVKEWRGKMVVVFLGNTMIFFPSTAKAPFLFPVLLVITSNQ